MEVFDGKRVNSRWCYSFLNIFFLTSSTKFQCVTQVGLFLQFLQYVYIIIDNHRLLEVIWWSTEPIMLGRTLAYFKKYEEKCRLFIQLNNIN